MAGSISGKSLVLLSMLIGMVCVTLWALGKNSQQAAIDPAVSWAMVMQPTRNSIPRFQPLNFMQPASRSVFTQAEKAPLDSAPGRREILTGMASLAPLVAIADQAKAANKAVSPELEEQVRALAGKQMVKAKSTKNFIEDEPPKPTKAPYVGLGGGKKAAPAETTASSAAPSAPSLPSFSAPSLPGGFKFKLPAPF